MSTKEESSVPPNKIKEAMAGALMSKAAMQQTIAGMDEKDKVDLTLGGGVEAGVDTSFGTTKGSINFDYTKSLGKDNASDTNLRVKSSNKTTASVGITFKAAKLGASVPCSFNLIYKNGVFDEWNFKVGLSKSMSLGDFSKEMLIATEWISDMGNAMSNAIYQANKGVNNPNMAQIAGQIGNMAIGPEAIKYTALGEGLKNVAASPNFGDKMGLGVKFDIKGQAGWSKSKGWNTAISLETSKSISLGKAGSSPLAIDLKSSDKILTFAAGTAKGISFGS